MKDGQVSIVRGELCSKAELGLTVQSEPRCPGFERGRRPATWEPYQMLEDSTGQLCSRSEAVFSRTRPCMSDENPAGRPAGGTHELNILRPPSHVWTASFDRRTDPKLAISLACRDRELMAS